MRKVEDKEKYTNYSKMSEDAVKASEEAKKAAEAKKVSPPEKPKQDAKPHPVEPYVVSLLVKKLNVRKAPNAKAQAVSVLSSGKSVVISAEKEGNDTTWGLIKDLGWINLEFVQKK